MISGRTLGLFSFAGLCGMLLLVTADPAESLVNHSPSQPSQKLNQPIHVKGSTTVEPKTITSSRALLQEATPDQPAPTQNDGFISDTVPHYLFGENVVLEIESLDYAQLDEIQIGTECQIGDLTVYKANRIQPSELAGQSEYTINTRELFFEELMDRSQDVECNSVVAYQYQSKDQEDVLFTLEQQLAVHYLAH